MFSQNDNIVQALKGQILKMSKIKQKQRDELIFKIVKSMSPFQKEGLKTKYQLIQKMKEFQILTKQKQPKKQSCLMSKVVDLFTIGGQVNLKKNKKVTFILQNQTQKKTQKSMSKQKSYIQNPLNKQKKSKQKSNFFSEDKKLHKEIAQLPQSVEQIFSKKRMYGKQQFKLWLRKPKQFSENNPEIIKFPKNKQQLQQTQTFICQPSSFDKPKSLSYGDNLSNRSNINGQKNLRKYFSIQNFRAPLAPQQIKLTSQKVFKKSILKYRYEQKEKHEKQNSTLRRFLSHKILSKNQYKQKLIQTLDNSELEFQRSVLVAQSPIYQKSSSDFSDREVKYQRQNHEKSQLFQLPTPKLYKSSSLIRVHKSQTKQSHQIEIQLLKHKLLNKIDVSNKIIFKKRKNLQ